MLNFIKCLFLGHKWNDYTGDTNSQCAQCGKTVWH